MPQFFDHQRRGIMIEHFVNRRHGTHLHQHLDYITGLDCNALRQVSNRYRLGNFHITHHGSSRFFKAMQVFNIVYLPLPLLEFLLSIRLMRRLLDMQLLASITRTLVVMFTMLAGFVGGRRCCTCRGGGFKRYTCRFFSRFGSLGFGALLFDYLLRHFYFLQAFGISFLFGFGPNRLFLG